MNHENRRKSNNIADKKTIVFKSPDTTKLQTVVIDLKTKIYIAQDADPEEARKRYHDRIDAQKKMLFSPKKPLATT